jgi:hypothetical protein
MSCLSVSVGVETEAASYSGGDSFCLDCAEVWSKRLVVSSSINLSESANDSAISNCEREINEKMP